MTMDLGARPKTTLPHLPPDPLPDDSDDDSAITALPDEILEHILSLISPYRDLESSALVCRRWLSCCRRVICHRSTHFTSHVVKGGLLWTHQPTLESATTITKRYSHCAVYHAASTSMFVFGGCTSTSSTFNDLWQLDLSWRTWRRPLAMGTYPSPKACATLVLHEDTLVLFGGWTHPSLYPLHQSWKLFSELHVYHIQESRWSQVLPTERPPAMAGHSATVHGETMVVFGGLHKQRSIGHYTSSSDVWTFHLALHSWLKMEIEGDEKPSPRYGQSQIYLDQNHLLVLGGCGGPNNEFTDIWLLRMGSLPWGWVQMDIRGEENRAKDIWCHPACRVGEKVVVLGKNKVSATSPQTQASQQPAGGGNQAWNVIPQLRRGINRGTGAIRRGGGGGHMARDQRPGFGSAPAPHHQSRNDESHWRSAQDSSDSDMEIAVEPVPSLPRSQPSAGPPSLPRSQPPTGGPALARSQPPAGAFRLQPLAVGVRGRGGPSSTIVRPESTKTSPCNEPTPSTSSPSQHNQERPMNLPTSPSTPTYRSMINVNIPLKPSPIQSPLMSQKAFGSSFSPIQSPSMSPRSPSGSMPGRWEATSSPSAPSGPNSPFPPPTPTPSSAFPPPTPASAASALIPVKITPAHAKSFGPGANTGMTDPTISGPRPNSSGPNSSPAPPPPGARPGAPGTPDFTQQPFHNQKNRQKTLENRQRQLATLQRMEDRIRNSPRSSPAGPKTPPSSASSVCPRHRMTTFILDISTAVSSNYVTWMPVTASSSLTAPPESILYSLVQGRTELIMFGGLQKDISLGAGRGGGQQNNTETVSNCLYYLNPPADVI